MAGILEDIAGSLINQESYQVYIKTNLGPEVMVYDSSAPSDDQPSILSGLVEAGISIRTSSGKELANYGGYPETNILLSLGLGGLIGFSLFSLIRGAIK